MESRARTVAEACRELSRFLIGQDPLRIEYLYNVMYKNSFYRGGPVLTSAMSGIEHPYEGAQLAARTWQAQEQLQQEEQEEEARPPAPF